MTQEQTAIAVGGGALVLAWLWKSKTLTGTVTTSETFDLSPYGGPTSYSPKVQRFAQAIARQEGFYVTGAIPQIANNPGDLKIAGLPTLAGTSITRFSSIDAGWNALYRQLHLILTGASSYYTLDMTIEEMARVWTATEQAAWSANVARQLGVPVSTPLWSVLA